ncbi:hypothetical protein D1R32_gp379 [Tunisvirus fontaine2]|uniref:Uncharacterized protein n=1 Tax=Tunisvirus fontaine2 TaxID=1421067 RepID=V9SFK4_9VIRU|nr:hypothetical protein D1R32_gp379 [Tunisvirus fontaine2]AHC55096.1 hypothetical protein TNS_ORF378 [Tunisvirus fontaine2]
MQQNFAKYSDLMRERLPESSLVMEEIYSTGTTINSFVKFSNLEKSFAGECLLYREEDEETQERHAISPSPKTMERDDNTLWVPLPFYWSCEKIEQRAANSSRSKISSEFVPLDVKKSLEKEEMKRLSEKIRRRG